MRTSKIFIWLTIFFSIALQQVSHAENPYNIDNNYTFSAKILGLDFKNKRIRVVTKTPAKKQKNVLLQMLPTTALGIETEVVASQLRIGDSILWFYHQDIATATGKERRRVSRVFGATSPNDFFRKGEKYTPGFSLFMDPNRLTTVASLHPLTLRMFDQGQRGAFGMDYPLDESDYPTLRYGKVATLSLAQKSSDEKDVKQNIRPYLFTFHNNEERKARFCLYQPLVFADLRIGQRIGVTMFPLYDGRLTSVALTDAREKNSLR